MAYSDTGFAFWQFTASALLKGCIHTLVNKFLGFVFQNEW